MPQITTQFLGQIQRSLEKRQFKQALKDARVAHRQLPSETTRHLLQICSFARADELQRNGLASESQNVIDELCSFTPLPLEIHEQLADLLIRLGLFETYASKLGFAVEAISEERQRAQADIAVLTGRGGTADVTETATAIRRSLQAIELGEVDQAMLSVDAIPRNSPFADWKLFVRGLIAYYRGDDSAMAGNWNRLDSTRKAIRIASRLRVVAEVAAGAPRSESADRAISLVERIIGGETLGHLDAVQKLVNNGDHRRSLEVLQCCLVSLEQRNPKLKERVIEMVIQSAIRSGSMDLLERLTGAASGPAFDPHWNRARAMICESQENSEFDLIEKYWRKYAAEVSSIRVWSDSERQLAEALVWSHLGELYVSMAEGEYCDDDDDFYGENDDDFGSADQSWKVEDQERALDCFSKAQSLAPDVVKFWKAPVVAACVFDQPEAVTESLSKLVKQFPDDYESLMMASANFLEFNRPAEALPLCQRAFQLKPLDETARRYLFRSHWEVTHHLAIIGKFDESRTQLDLAKKVDVKSIDCQGNADEILTRRSIIERKAGNNDLAEELDRQVCRMFQDPCYPRLQLLVEAIRFELPSSVIAQFEVDWGIHMSKKCSSDSAGRMSKYLMNELNRRALIDRLKFIVEQLVGYLKRASRVKFEREDLCSVCEFFWVLNRKLEIDLNPMDELKKAATRGEKHFPDDPRFPMHLADIEYARGPQHANLAKMDKLLARSSQLAEEHPDYASPELIKKIHDRKEELEMARSPFGFELPFRLPFFN